MPYTLVLLRHGQSTWNLENRFTGWVDVDLTDEGIAQARRAGQDLANARILPDILHTSVQVRAIHTAELALRECGRSWIPVRRSWRLNERHYGALQGKDKAETARQFSPEQVKIWRRSYDIAPDPMPIDDPNSGIDERYDALPRDVLPRRVPEGRARTHAALVGGRDRSRPAHGRDRAGRRARQLAAGAREAPRRDDARSGRGAQPPDRRAVGLRARRRPAAAAGGGAGRDPRPLPRPGPGRWPLPKAWRSKPG